MLAQTLACGIKMVGIHFILHAGMLSEFIKYVNDNVEDKEEIDVFYRLLGNLIKVFKGTLLPH